MKTLRGGLALIFSIAFLAIFFAFGAQANWGTATGGGSFTSTVADTLYCKLTGCTMTGGIAVSGGATTLLARNDTATVYLNLGTVSSGKVFAAADGQGVPTLLVQNCDGTNGCLKIVGPARFDGVITSGTSTTTDATTGTCSSVTVAGTVLDFSVTATCTSAQTVNVTFSAGFGAAPICVLSPANAAAGAVTTGEPYQSAGATTSATFTFPIVTAGKYNVHCFK